MNETSPLVKEKVKEKPKVQKKIQKKKVKKKLVKKIVKKETIKTPQPKVEVAPEPVEEIQEESHEVVEELVQNEVTSSSNTQKVLNTSKNKAVDAELLKSKQDKFLSYLVQKINANKSYPNSARRRAIEGNIEMKFHVCSDGGVKNIKMLSGKSIFKKSAHQAIARSFPVEIDKKLFSFPKEFRITIAYVLK